MGGSAIDPFYVLGVSPDCHPTTVEVAYRALARRYHPDMVASGSSSTEKMKELNWARDELRRDFDGWRTRVTEARKRSGVTVFEPSPTRPAGTIVAEPIAWVQVEPQVVFLEGIPNITGTFRARATVDSSEIRARVRTSLPLDVIRLSDRDGWAEFQVKLTGVPSYDGEDSAVFEIELACPDHYVNRVFVYVAPPVVGPAGNVLPPRTVGVDQRISFGKYKGRTFGQLAHEAPGYLEWVIRQRAGGVIEQRCAELALGYTPEPKLSAGRSKKLSRTAGGRRTSAQALPRAQSRPPAAPPQPLPLALPDPAQRRGLLGGIKARLRIRKP